MLIGEVDHSIDAKGRYIVPAKFRADLGSRFVITKGLDGCLFVYTMTAWDGVLEAMKQLPSNDPRARRFARFFLSRAFEAEIDKQFRVVLPPQLREHAQIEKDIVTVGVSTRLEIWDKARWEAYDAESGETYEEDAALYPGVVL